MVEDAITSESMGTRMKRGSLTIKGTRAIASIDLEFAIVRDYPPQDYPGLIADQLPGKPAKRSAR
jgi:hypothetical protein